MSGGVRLLVLGVVAAVLGVATAHAAASGQLPGTTTADTATTATATTGTTTSTTAATTTSTTSTTAGVTTTTATTATTTTTSTSTEPTTTPGLTTTEQNAIDSSGPQKQSRKHSKKQRRRRLPTRPPPDYPLAPNPLLDDGALAPAALQNAAVSIAVRYLGVRYLWGGVRPKTGFDCSGLVQYVFARLGVSLPHNAAAQYYSPDAVWVRPSRLQSGDLVFFTGADGTRQMPGHVGIYVGDGYFIDAPHTGSFVRVDSLDAPAFANTYVGAKRIVDAPLDARVFATQDGTFPTLHRQLTSLSSASPRLVAAVPTATHASTPRGYALWAALGLGGLLLLLGGGVTYGRRRTATEADPGTSD